MATHFALQKAGSKVWAKGDTAEGPSLRKTPAVAAAAYDSGSDDSAEEEREMEPIHMDFFRLSRLKHYTIGWVARARARLEEKRRKLPDDQQIMRMPSIYRKSSRAAVDFQARSVRDLAGRDCVRMCG